MPREPVRGAPAPSSARVPCRTTTAALARPAWPRSACSRWSSTARRRRHSSSSAIGCASRCSTPPDRASLVRSEEHTSELQSLMRISYPVFCLQKKHILIQVLTIHYIYQQQHHYHTIVA